MPPGQQPDPSLNARMKESFHWLYFLANAYAACLLPFIRHGMGTRGIGAAGFFAWLLMLAYAGHTASPEMLIYIKAWFVFAVYRRIRADRRQLTGYQGWPLLTGWLIRSDRLARAVEAVLVYLIGSHLCQWSESVGRFIACGAYALAAKLYIETAIQRQHQEAAHNAVVQMEIMQARMEEARMNHR
jgi:hypothetical protein